jgi:hypothetical protein
MIGMLMREHQSAQPGQRTPAALHVQDGVGVPVDLQVIVQQSAGASAQAGATTTPRFFAVRTNATWGRPPFGGGSSQQEKFHDAYYKIETQWRSRE